MSNVVSLSTALRSVTPASTAEPTEPVFEQGRNCWRVETAPRAAVLVDGADYFRRLDTVLRQARHSISIIGWGFDGGISLRPDLQEGGGAVPLGVQLRLAVERNPGLVVNILVWSVAVVHAPGAPGPLLFGSEWQNHPRIRLRLDAQHPFYASHHQKIVVVDDAVACVGGIDLTLRRWDDCSHAPEHPLRVSAGEPYAPVHDAQMIVDGDAAMSIGDLARERWRMATGETLARTQRSGGDLWPADLVPEFCEQRVAIARSAPRWRGRRSVREAARLTRDMIRAARRSIYIEAQYLTAGYVRRALRRRLQEPDGPEVLVVMTSASHGFVEQLVMGSNGDRLIRRLRRADRYRRFRVYYPALPGPDGDCPIQVHAKVIAVDDRILRIGSSNLNNRSICVDTECDLAIQAGDGAARSALAQLRDRLIAEHLDVVPAAFTAAVEAEGSLLKAVERLNVHPRGLRLHSAMRASGPTDPMPGTWFLDPRRLLDPMGVVRRTWRRLFARREAA